jgi:hypothetical protein
MCDTGRFGHAETDVAVGVGDETLAGKPGLALVTFARSPRRGWVTLGFGTVRKYDSHDRVIDRICRSALVSTT